MFDFAERTDPNFRRSQRSTKPPFQQDMSHDKAPSQESLFDREERVCARGSRFEQNGWVVCLPCILLDGVTRGFSATVSISQDLPIHQTRVVKDADTAMELSECFPLYFHLYKYLCAAPLPGWIHPIRKENE